MTVQLDSAGHFECPRHDGHLRLSPASCASMWQRGRKAPGWFAVSKCRGCPIGAEHAGIPAAEHARLALEDQAGAATHCIRCGRAGVRILNKTVCVSCWNRCKEFVRGTNSKGSRPRDFAPMSFFTTAVRGRVTTLSARALVPSLFDFISVVLRHRPGAELEWPPADQPFCGPLERLRQRGRVQFYKPVFSKETAQ